jgi:hypothetical protein
MPEGFNVTGTLNQVDIGEFIALPSGYVLNIYFKDGRVSEARVDD